MIFVVKTWHQHQHQTGNYCESHRLRMRAKSMPRWANSCDARTRALVWCICIHRSAIRPSHGANEQKNFKCIVVSLICDLLTCFSCQHALNVRDKEASNYVKSGASLCSVTSFYCCFHMFLCVGFVLLQHESDDVDLCVVDWEQYVPDAIHCYEIAVQVFFANTNCKCNTRCCCM